MDYAVPPATRPVSGAFPVPASKSLVQRALAIHALSSGPPATGLEGDGGAAAPAGDDVRAMARAVERLGRLDGRSLGSSRDRLTLDLGLSATAFRLATALATLRPAGARTLVRGRPALLRRPHADLRRALNRLGGHVRRRHSGAHRVLGGGLAGGRLSVPCRTSSQHVTALLLIAPVIGGLTLTLVDRPVSRPYLALTLDLMRRAGVQARASGLEAAGGRIDVPAGAYRAHGLRLEPDASAAAAWWAAAALTGGRATVPGLPAGSAQADAVLPSLLARMGARLEPAAGGEVCVQGGGALRGAGTLDLSDAPDLVPLVAVLAAGAQGTTRLEGVSHVRGKESDRLASTLAGLRALGADGEETGDGLEIRGRPLHGGVVDAAGDHRLVIAFGVLGLCVPGVVIRGAEAVRKSQPGLLEALTAASR